MKFRLIAGIVLVVVLFGCYVVTKNMTGEEGQAPQEAAEQSGYGGLGK